MSLHFDVWICRLLVCSRCLGHQPSEVQLGRTPKFFAPFLRGPAPFIPSPRNPDRAMWWRSQQKWLRPWRDLFFLYSWHVGHLNVDFKCSYTLANNDSANDMTRSQRRTGTLWVLRDRKLRHKWNSEGWRPRHLEHTKGSWNNDVFNRDV